MVGLPTSFYALIERIRTGSIMAPLLALAFLTGLFALLATWVSRNDTLIAALWGLFALCVVAALVAYVVWGIVAPDRLQTEDYRLARHRLDVFGDERDPNSPLLIDSSPTVNTHLDATK